MIMNVTAYSNEHRDYYLAEYLRGIDLFNQGSYYEAHEEREEIWRHVQGEQKLYYQGLIQTAAALLHYGRGNRRGAHLCINNALKKLESLPHEFFSLNLALFTAELREFFGAVIDNGDIAGRPGEYARPLIGLLPLKVVQPA